MSADDSDGRRWEMRRQEGVGESDHEAASCGMASAIGPVSEPKSRSLLHFYLRPSASSADDFLLRFGSEAGIHLVADHAGAWSECERLEHDAAAPGFG